MRLRLTAEVEAEWRNLRLRLGLSSLRLRLKVEDWRLRQKAEAEVQ